MFEFVKSKIVSWQISHLRDPHLAIFRLQKLYKHDEDLLSSCYSRAKAHGIVSVLKNVLDSSIEGDVAECGVYRAGGTIMLARILMESHADKHIYAFDSFEGMPESTDNDRTDNGEVRYRKGELSGTSLGYVLAKARYFRVDALITFVKGYFEETLAQSITQDSKFCFVVIDADQYKGTKFCLEFFYYKVIRGGCVVVDDYFLQDKDSLDTPGVKIATDEFFEG